MGTRYILTSGESTFINTNSPGTDGTTYTDNRIEAPTFASVSEALTALSVFAARRKIGCAVAEIRPVNIVSHTDTVRTEVPIADLLTEGTVPATVRVLYAVKTEFGYYYCGHGGNGGGSAWTTDPSEALTFANPAHALDPIARQHKRAGGKINGGAQLVAVWNTPTTTETEVIGEPL